MVGSGLGQNVCLWSWRLNIHGCARNLGTANSAWHFHSDNSSRRTIWSQWATFIGRNVNAISILKSPKCINGEHPQSTGRERLHKRQKTRTSTCSYWARTRVLKRNYNYLKGWNTQVYVKGVKWLALTPLGSAWVSAMASPLQPKTCLLGY